MEISSFSSKDYEGKMCRDVLRAYFINTTNVAGIGAGRIFNSEVFYSYAFVSMPFLAKYGFESRSVLLEITSTNL